MTQICAAFALAAGVMVAATGAMAQEVEVDGNKTLGIGSVFANDVFGDGRDRWRSSSYTVSWVRGQDWTGDLPDSFGEVIEYRFNASTITPEDLTTPNPADRAYAGALSVGAYSHFQFGKADIGLGGGLAFTGPDTGHGSFQREAHELLGVTPPSDAVLANQIGNAVYLTAELDVTGDFRISDGVTFRPFFQVQSGIETLARVGGDVIFGGFGQNSLLLRDEFSGQLYDAVGKDDRGLSFLIGADTAKVFHSAIIPASSGLQLTDTRDRVRAGVNWQGERVGLFYGVTWLGKEFVGQSDSQIVGTIDLRLKF
ncbi:MAG: hypothetical protein CMM86_04945 [Rhodovulum sp.]|nr:hypothetical protein [Rhodovulum sp.]